jgi:hypothetical protein
MERLYLSPNEAFRRKWPGWGPFLGTGSPKRATYKTPEQWVVVAKALYKENDGVLPNSKWLQDNGYKRLDAAMRKRPDLFEDLKQIYNGGRTPEEWISDAEDLARNHGGVLPHCNWLISNGYRGLYVAMRNNRELFSKFEQDVRRKTQDEWVDVAERLAAEHGGVLPNSKWLSSNGYGGLAQAIRRTPELFDHVNQARLIKSPEEWVSIAESLALENGGLLPCISWLHKHQYQGLSIAMRKRPGLFIHIKQERRDSHGRLINDSREEVG